MKKETGILVLCAGSLFFFILSLCVGPDKKINPDVEMARASEIMAAAMAAISQCRTEKNIGFDAADVNHTGLIGLEFSSLTTSLGNLEAKRTTTNPNFAGLLVFLLKKAGVRRGEMIAVGASSSFPALIIATHSAAKAMGLRTLQICSLGASQWGANYPSFTWMDMEDCLWESGFFRDKTVAFSLGGEKDIGEDMTPEGRAFLAEKINKSQKLFIQEPDLRRNVLERIRIYMERAGQREIKAFINIGGNWANLGMDSQVLKMKPGLTFLTLFSPPEKRGVIQEMALRRIPIIHLLYIRGLTQKHGLPWDPAPLPQSGKGTFQDISPDLPLSFLLLSGLYLVFVFLVFKIRRKTVSRNGLSFFI
ncbi:MAG: poly-gamma-glutamate system protein [Candidatus Aminicenantales bacterium]